MGYMRCWSARNVLDLYADGRLAPRWQAFVSGHLKDCASCRHEAEASGKIPGLEPSGAIAAPEGLVAAILAGLETDAEPARGAAAPWEGLRLGPARAAALAFIALLFADGTRTAVPSQSLTPAASWEWEAPK